MRSLIDQVLEEIRSAWRFRWLALAVGGTIALLGWMAVFAMPDRYQAGAKVFVDTRTALKPVLQGLTVGQDVDAELNYVRQSLLAGPQLERIAREAGVIPPGSDAHSREQLLQGLGNRIEISVRSASGREEDRSTAGSIYSIDFQDGDRARSLKVVTTLLDTLVNQTLGGKREGAESAQQFLQTQIHDYEQRLRTAEDRLAAFKSRHIGLLPTEQGGAFAELQKENNAIDDTKTKLAQSRARRAELERQLRGDAAVAASAPAPSAAAGGGTGAGFDTLSRIAETQARLDELLLKFTDKHPDVIAARQTLEELQRRRAAEVDSLKHGDADAAATSRASANPVYQSIQLELNKEDVEIADLNMELEQQETKAAELRRLLDTAPQVEAEYAQLNRDYDVNKSQYTALLGNYEKARLGERADNAGSVRFEIVEPPAASYQPVWPHRVQLLGGVLLAALAAGAAVAYGLHQLHPVLSSVGALAELTGVTVLGMVGSAFPQRTRRAAIRDRVRLACAFGGLFVAFGVAVALSAAGLRLSLPMLKYW